MDLMEVSLIVIGIMMVISSFFFMNQEKEETENYTGEAYEQLLAKEKLLELQLEQKCEQLAERVYEKVDEQLCQLSNEKIMSVNEYGNEVLEKIQQNHSEVVFLYSMLNEKEKEIKTFAEKQYPVEANKMVSNAEAMEEKETKKAQTNLGRKKSNKKIEKNKIDKDTAQKMVFTGEDRAEYDKKKEKIIALYRQGKEVLEISKKLELGQGEVQLIVNLYKEANV